MTVEQLIIYLQQVDPVIVCKMIRNAMQQRQDIAAAMIAAVISYADDNGIPRHRIGDMVKFYPHE